MRDKTSATDKLTAMASVASRARRGVFNAAEAGLKNLLGENELVDAVARGDVKLEELDEAALPEAMKPMAPEQQSAYVAQLATERSELKQQIRDLSETRSNYLAKKVDEDGGAKDSLDQKLYDAVKEQAGKAGFEYEDGPAY